MSEEVIKKSALLSDNLVIIMVILLTKTLVERKFKVIILGGFQV